MQDLFFIKRKWYNLIIIGLYQSLMEKKKIIIK